MMFQQADTNREREQELSQEIKQVVEASCYEELLVAYLGKNKKNNRLTLTLFSEWTDNETKHGIINRLILVEAKYKTLIDVIDIMPSIFNKERVIGNAIYGSADSVVFCNKKLPEINCEDTFNANKYDILRECALDFVDNPSIMIEFCDYVHNKEKSKTSKSKDDFWYGALCYYTPAMMLDFVSVPSYKRCSYGSSSPMLYFKKWKETRNNVYRKNENRQNRAHACSACNL